MNSPMRSGAFGITSPAALRRIRHGATNLSDKIARSIEAQRILDSELTIEAFEKLEAVYTAAWRNGKTVEQREDAHRYVTLLDKLEAHFRSIVTTGAIEATEQKRLEGRKGWSFTR